MSQQDGDEFRDLEAVDAEAPASPQQVPEAWENPFFVDDEDEEVDDEEVDDLLDEVDEMDMDEAWDEEAPELDSAEQDDAEEWLSDDEEDYITPKQRVQLECGVLEHDANFFVADNPTHHSQVPSSTCHHQTADAVTFLPRSGAAVVGADSASGGVAAASVDVEEVLVSNRATLSIYQLATGKPARLLARSGTCFKHYSIAASPCGNFIAASGNSGLVVLFRVQRSNPSQQQQEGTPAAAAATAGNSSASSKGSNLPGSGPAEGPESLPWRIVHEATLLCVNNRETMVNSVRFGQFGGVPRLLVSHQDGMLYLFNLPDASPTSSAAPAAAAGGPGTGSANNSTSASTPGAALMVRGLADWEPQGSQINRRYVEQMTSILDRHKQRSRQQQQQDTMQVDADAQQQGQQPADSAAASSSAAAAAAGQKRQQQQQRSAQAGAKLRRIEPERMMPDSKEASVEAQLTTVSEGLGGLGLDGSGVREAQVQTQPGSLQHLELSIKGAERLLIYVVQNLAASCEVAGELQQRYGPSFPGSGHKCFTNRSWAEKCKHIGHLLQDEQCTLGVQRLQRMRFIFADEAVPYKWITYAKDYIHIVNSLKKAAQGQEALLGWRGQQRQQQQWQKQLDDGDADEDVAMCRAVYVLLLLRLLAPSGRPTIKQNARVLLIKHGPQVDPTGHLQRANSRAAPRLQTCAISNIAPDTAAQQRAIAAAREAERLQAEANQPGASAEQVAAAAIAAQDAQVAAAEQQILPLNICESSPDGSWLAVGVDQAAIVLVPAGPGYPHHASQVLDLCPPLAPRTNHWQTTGTLGCQYLAFNSSSTLLAATSDHLKVVSVFEVATGQLLATFSLHNRPILPVRFMSNFIRRDFSRRKGAEASLAHAEGKQQQQQQQGSENSLRVTQGSQADAAAQDAAAAGESGDDTAPIMHELWGDHVVVYCESTGGLHIADMSTFVSPLEQQSTTAAGPAALPAPKASAAAAEAAAEAQHGLVSPKFCLKTYIEVPPEPAAQPTAAGAAGAAAAGAPGGPQPQQQQQHQDEAEAILDAALFGAQPPVPAAAAPAPVAAQKINGLVVTPAGRVLVACSRELLEWQLLTGWSPEHHSRFPPAFKAAVRLLLTAAAHPGAGSSATAAMDTETAAAPADHASTAAAMNGALLLSQLPSAVLERIIADAALPQGEWGALKIPTLQQLLNTLEARPRLPDDVHGHWNMGMFEEGPDQAGVVLEGQPINAAMLQQVQQMLQVGAVPANAPPAVQWLFQMLAQQGGPNMWVQAGGQVVGQPGQQQQQGPHLGEQ